MILKGNQRGGALNLARHLLNDWDNDHVTVHAIEGFVAPDVAGALMEIYAVSRATKCRQFMFSLSLSPPKDAIVTIQDFKDAIDQAAEKLGLQNQPRVILTHEKQARLHCHAIFSRIDVAAMKAVNLPFYKERLNDLARELYLSHKWELPKGLADRSLSNPLNFGLAEWQEAQRAKRDPREIKAALKQCWTQSDGTASFGAALKERGFWLARGDRRGFVAVDYKGNIYSLSRWLDVKPKELKARLGEPERHTSVEATKANIGVIIGDAAKRVAAEMGYKQAQAMKPLLDQRQRIVTRQRLERKELQSQHAREHAQQALDHAQLFRRGLKGLFDWLTGKRGRIRRTIEVEMEATQRRTQAALSSLSRRQAEERSKLQVQVDRQRQHATKERHAFIELFLHGNIVIDPPANLCDSSQHIQLGSELEHDYF